jgi:hypothetical protein
MRQPSLSRLENLASWRDLARMGFATIDLFCGSFARAKRPSGREAARIIALVTKRIRANWPKVQDPLARRQPLCNAGSPAKPGG